MCPPGYYPESITNVCEPCHPSCFTCMGRTEVYCTGCHTGKFLAYPISDLVEYTTCETGCI